MAKNGADAWCAVAAFVADAAAAFSAVFFSVWVRFETNWFGTPFGRPESIYSGYWRLALVAVLLSFVTLRSLHLYHRPQRGSFHSHVPRLVRGSLMVTTALLVLLALVKNYYNLSAGVVIIYFFSFSLFLLLERAILFRLEIVLCKRLHACNSVLIIGTDSTALRLARALSRDPRLRIRVSGYILADDGETPAPGINPKDILGSVQDFQTILTGLPDVAQVIVSVTPKDHALLPGIAYECERRLIRFNVVPDMFRILTASVEVETVDDVPLLGLKHSPLDSVWNRFAKRFVDIVCSLILLILCAPVMLCLAILIKRESPGAVFYRQTRTGYGNRPFTIYKMRSMRSDAEKNTGAVFAEKDDPRRTKIGAFMRSHNLDELPQFWNVLKGDMSLVGPRPERPEFVRQFSREIDHYMRRHDCRPGITGWAQVHGLRGNTSIQERLHADLWYMANWSLSLDLKILLRTIFAVRNAY